MTKILITVSFFCLSALFLYAGAVEGPDADGLEIIHADAMTDDGSLQVLRGNVLIKRGKTRLQAGRMEYTRATGILQAWDDVSIQDESFLLNCSRLTFSTKENEAVAWGNPTVRQMEKGGKGAFETELTGVQIRMFTRENRLQVLEDVVLTRYKLGGPKGRTVDLRIGCRSLEALSSAKKSAFRGGVTIETPTIGAKGENALFDQMSGEFYIIGAASAWNYDHQGQRLNIVRGDKIVYFTKEKRTVVIGNVTADVDPDRQAGEKLISLQLDPVGDTAAVDGER